MRQNPKIRRQCQISLWKREFPADCRGAQMYDVSKAGAPHSKSAVGIPEWGGRAMGKNWVVFMQQQEQLANVMKANQVTEQYGLVLSEQDAKLILEERWNVLREQKRVEFGPGITEKLIYEFCDSAYVNQNNYVDTILRLQEIFYLYKNEMQDEITDDELLHFMKEQFEGVCFGDLEYLEGTCLEIFAQAIRTGYRGYTGSEGYGEYEKFDPAKRWDADLYREVLKGLIWR